MPESAQVGSPLCPEGAGLRAGLWAVLFCAAGHWGAGGAAGPGAGDAQQVPAELTNPTFHQGCTGPTARRSYAHTEQLPFSVRLSKKQSPTEDPGVYPASRRFYSLAEACNAATPISRSKQDDEGDKAHCLAAGKLQGGAVR